LTNYIETYRGNVSPWEVDSTEHFTVAFYYEKFEAATWRFLRQAGVDPRICKTTEALTHYKAELRNRDIYKIETACIQNGDHPRIAHKLFNAESGELCTTMQQDITGISLDIPKENWDGDIREDRAIPNSMAKWLSTSNDVTRPEETNWSGNLSMPGFIHRYSTANSFILAAFGLTSEYLTKSRIGLSTFEFQLTFKKAVTPGTLLDIESCIAHLGGSSIRLFHKMTDAETGEAISSLSQFGVHLDLDSRRPSRIPDSLRDRAKDFL
jgi:acyl-CoA thioesterase FadM